MRSWVPLLLLANCSVAYADNYELPPVIDNSGYPAQAQGIAPQQQSTINAASSQSVYELVTRIEQLQREVQLLTGKAEEQAYQIAELKKQQKVMYADFDERLQSIETKGGSKTTESPSTSSDNGSDKVPDKVIDASPAPTNITPKTDTSKTTTVKKTTELKPSEPGNNVPPTTPTLATKAPAPADYQSALTTLRNGRTSQAIDLFNRFLQSNPTSDYNDDAQYWLGEAYRINNDADAARKAFNTLLDNTPQSKKIPDALLKLGVVEMDQKNTDKARQYLERVRDQYPTSAAAKLASKKLESLQ